MRITKATTYIVGNPWKNWLFVRLDTDQPGLYGVGEGSLNGFAKTIEAAIHELSHFYEGMDPFQIETICQRMSRDPYNEGGQIHMNAVAAIGSPIRPSSMARKQVWSPAPRKVSGAQPTRRPTFAAMSAQRGPFDRARHRRQG